MVRENTEYSTVHTVVDLTISYLTSNEQYIQSLGTIA